MMGRTFPCSCMEAYVRNISYLSRSNYYAFPSFNSLKYSSSSSPYLQGNTNFRGQRRNMYISAKPTLKSLPLKDNHGNLIEVGSFDIEASLAMDAPPKKALNGIIGNLNTENKVEEKAGGLDHDIMMQTAKHTEEMEWLARIKIGDVINLKDLLFTQSRDYLIRHNDDRQVKAKDLADKVIAVYLVPFLDDSFLERMATTHLIDTYNYLLPHNVFEVVLVAYETDLERLNMDSQTNPEERFEAMFSRMPWTAIPFSDIKSRERVSRKFGIFRSEATLDSFVIDSTGMVLQSDCLSYFEVYGGLGYPFTDGRILFLQSQDDALAEQPSLKMLLASPDRDYIISNKGDKVLIDTLEEKVVALFFYEEGKTLDRLTADIKLAYEEYAEKKNEFEVVLIYLYDTENTCGYTNEESFHKTFKSMPWLALPFKDPTYRKLKRLFGHNLDLGDRVESPPSLVIFGPHGEFIEPWGADILMTYKLPAYPFTREKVAKLETEKIKELKLEMLWDLNTLFRKNDGTEVPLYELVGERIILFFEGNNYDNHAACFLNLLKNSYAQMKGTDDEFEVIYITSGKQEALYQDMVFDVPWLFALESEMLPVNLSLYCCYYDPISFYAEFGFDCPPDECGRNSTLLAFDRDGRLVRKSVYLNFDGTDFFYYTDFPFYDADMEEEALLELSEHHEWLDRDRQYSGLVINSLYHWHPR